MATPNRAALISKLYKVLKKHYTPVVLPQRPVLEQMLYAVLLENASYDQANKAFETASTTFFDWNEVRVSTIKELAEIMHVLPHPAESATHLKQVLQSVFESTYTYDLESLRKQNLGQAVQRLKRIEGATHFAVALVTQLALSGHSIPLDRAAFEVLSILGISTDADAASGAVAGMERAIAKNKGIEFGSLLHQLAVELQASPHSTNLHKVLLEVTPDAKDRLPKRGGKKAEEPPPPAKKGAAPKKPAAVASKKPAPGKKPLAKAAAKASAPPSRSKPKPR
jgi:endonuclease-3